MLFASLAGAEDRAKIAEAVEAVLRASRSAEGSDRSELLRRIDPEQLELLRRTFGADAARAVAAVGALKLQHVTTVDPGVAEDDIASILGANDDLVRLGAMGLAAALRHAHETYAGGGHPLPDAVKVMLSISFSREVLDSVRVVDTDAEGSLPAIINELQANYGDAVGGTSAVTIDDLIAFSEIPDPSAVHFWAHEIQHVVQYRQLGGIGAFAAAYTRDYQKLEADASAIAQKAAVDAQNVLTVIEVLNPR